MEWGEEDQTEEVKFSGLGWYVPTFIASDFFYPRKPIRDYVEQELHDLLDREPTKIRVESMNMIDEGLTLHIHKSFLSQDKHAMQPHVRAFVERAVMAHAEWMMDLGPGAGHDGGRIVFEGTPAELVAKRATLTGEYLARYVGT